MITEIGVLTHPIVDELRLYPLRRPNKAPLAFLSSGVVQSLRLAAIMAAAINLSHFSASGREGSGDATFQRPFPRSIFRPLTIASWWVTLVPVPCCCS
jgi:hypothetical protein